MNQFFVVFSVGSLDIYVRRGWRVIDHDSVACVCDGIDTNDSQINAPPTTAAPLFLFPFFSVFR